MNLSSGIRITCFGNAMADTKAININLAPGKLFLANAYPARDAVIHHKYCCC